MTLIKPRLPETPQLAQLETLYTCYVQHLRREEYLEAASALSQMLELCPTGAYSRWLKQVHRYCQYKAVGISDRTAHGIGYWYGGEKIDQQKAKELLRQKLPRYEEKAAAASRRKEKYAKKAALEEAETK
jgi:hypothetical protein